MRKNVFSIIIFLCAIVYPLQLHAQNKIYFVGANTSYYIPIGSLSVRFLPTYGFNAYYGYMTSEDWEFYGRVEYFDFYRENRERLTIKRKVNIAGGEITRVFDLPKLELQLKVYGVSANGNYRIFENNFLNSNITFGFGIYRWEGFRSAYFDTLRIDTLGTTYDAVILKVPALKQLDWSGGFNVGLNLSVKVIDPIWLDLSANYKAVIGEMWATLNLDLENVSTFQMMEIRGGIKARF